MNKTIIISILFVLIAGLTGCATKSPEQVFQATMRAYDRVIRWGDISRSNQFRKEPIKFTQADRKRFKFIKVTGYEIQQTDRIDDSTMKVTVQIRYYNEQFMLEKTIEDVQTWNYDKDKQLWYISSPLPEF